MEIKALSLWQPWATLIGMEVKRYETRSWGTNYRGRLLFVLLRKRLPSKKMPGLI
ncbi:hypothetical protein [Nostoc linckia]|uniref:hypothetical protein n=1 Tax=Nostoc linckia TaxID=92942 RepID=UPI0015D49F02|nr:hypothetical protein [Nostoc linckia]